jgi:hypothetical protein
MGTLPVTDTATTARATQPSRIRALLIPREHGAWGLLLVPMFTGVAVGAASSRSVFPLLLFTAAALSLFWLRTPVESLLGTTPLSARTPAERKASLMASAGLAVLSAICLAGLLWNGRNQGLFFLGMRARPNSCKHPSSPGCAGCVDRRHALRIRSPGSGLVCRWTHYRTFLRPHRET